VLGESTPGHLRNNWRRTRLLSPAKRRRLPQIARNSLCWIRVTPPRGTRFVRDTTGLSTSVSICRSIPFKSSAEMCPERRASLQTTYAWDQPPLHWAAKSGKSNRKLRASTPSLYYLGWSFFTNLRRANVRSVPREPFTILQPTGKAHSVY